MDRYRYNIVSLLGIFVLMAIAWLLYYGYEMWTFKQDEQYKMTDYAVALRLKQYKMMEERGIVLNVDDDNDAA